MEDLLEEMIRDLGQKSFQQAHAHIYETLPLGIEDILTKQLRGKEILLVKVIWRGA